MERTRLIVKNFGPLKDIDIEVREMVCFIGKQATGKSTLAKLLAIFEDENFRKNDNVSFEEELKKYGMNSFLKKETYIYYSKEDYFVCFDKNKLSKINNWEDFKNNLIYLELNNKLSDKEKLTFIIESLFEFIIRINNKKDYSIEFKLNLEKEINTLFISNDISVFFKFLTSIFTNNANTKENNYKKVNSFIIKKFNDFIVNLNKESFISVDDFFIFYEEFLEQNFIYIKFDSQYIPSERNFLHLISENTLGLINNNVQIPKHLLGIGQEYEKALNTIKELPLKLIDKNLKYKREGKSSYIYHNQEDKVDLLQSASGLQSIIPVILLVEYAQTLKDTYNFNFVVEEPELNIYPETQHELIKYLVKNCLDKSEVIQQKNLIVTTHSPYILASINNLLLAYDKGQTKDKEVQKIIKKESWLDPKKFIAYQLKNGKATKIMDDKLGQIKTNMIDDASDAFSYEFDKLLDL